MKIEKLNNIVTGFLTNIGGTLAMFGVTIYLTRTVEQAVYGEFRLAFSFISLMVVLLLLGRDNGLLYYTQEIEEDEKNKIITEESFFTILILLGGTFLLFLFKGTVVNHVFNNNISVENYTLSLLMLPLWGFFNMGIAGLKVKNYINYSFTLTNLIQRLIRIPFFVLFVMISNSFFSLTISMILSQLVLLIIMIRKLPWMIFFKQVDISLFFSRFKYSIQLGLSSIIFVVLGKIDVIMLGNLSNVNNVAIYDICVMLSFVVIFPYLALVKSSEPIMKKILKDNLLLKKYNENLSLAISFASIIVFAFILQPSLILSIFGSEYSEGKQTLVILAVGYLLINFLATPIEFLNMTGNVKKSVRILIVALVLNIILNYLLIPKLGLNGAALATMISLACTKISALVYVKRELKLKLISLNNFKKLLPLVLVLLLWFFLKNIFLTEIDLIISMGLVVLLMVLTFFDMIKVFLISDKSKINK